MIFLWVYLWVKLVNLSWRRCHRIICGSHFTCRDISLLRHDMEWNTTHVLSASSLVQDSKESLSLTSPHSNRLALAYIIKINRLPLTYGYADLLLFKTKSFNLYFFVAHKEKFKKFGFHKEILQLWPVYNDNCYWPILSPYCKILFYETATLPPLTTNEISSRHFLNESLWSHQAVKEELPLDNFLTKESKIPHTKKIFSFALLEVEYC